MSINDLFPPRTAQQVHPADTVREMLHIAAQVGYELADNPRPRESNPLGLLCVECWQACVLSENGKWWLCPNGHE